MRDELFAIAETMAYQLIFTDMFPENFIENQVDISGVVEFLNKFDSIEVFIKNRSELEIGIDILEKILPTINNKVTSISISKSINTDS